jgi:hypothetical protein
MAQDYILETRRAVLPKLRTDAPLLELVAATSMYPSTVPAGRAFPFTRFGAVTATPFLASGMDSSALRFDVQAFTKPLMQGSQIVATAEDRAFLIGSAIKDALDGATLTLEHGLGKVRLAWVSSSPRSDPTESEAWMTTITFRAEVAH